MSGLNLGTYAVQVDEDALGTDPEGSRGSNQALDVPHAGLPAAGGGAGDDLSLSPGAVDAARRLRPPSPGGSRGARDSPGGSRADGGGDEGEAGTSREAVPVMRALQSGSGWGEAVTGLRSLCTCWLPTHADCQGCLAVRLARICMCRFRCLRLTKSLSAPLRAAARHAAAPRAPPRPSFSPQRNRGRLARLPALRERRLPPPGQPEPGRGQRWGSGRTGKLPSHCRALPVAVTGKQHALPI
jgi:hypothetical protein